MTTDKPTILMTADAVGGIWTYALDLGRALTQKDMRIVVAVLGPGLDDAKRRSAEAASLEVIETGWQPEWLAAEAAEVERAGQGLAELARSVGADLVHLNHPALGASDGFPAPMLAGCHSCVATWWDAVKGTDLPDDFRWRTDLVAAGYRAARLLVAPSRAFAEATQRLYGLERLPEVVHNGRAPGEPAAGAAAPIEAAFTAGRLWDEAKNARTLDRVAALTTAPFRAAGPVTGPNGASVELLHLDTLGALDQDSMRGLLAERPVYVSAASFEPFGLSVLEAAQAGCALVLSDIPSFRELWQDAAIFAPAQDEEALAAAVGRLLSDPELRADCANAAQNRARAFSLEAFVDDMAGLYKTLLSPAGTA